MQWTTQVPLGGTQDGWRGKREVMAIVLVGLAVFIGAALYSYNPYDSGVLHRANVPLNIYNWCGAVGAAVADVLIYLLGNTALIIPALLCGAALLVRTAAVWRDEWERVLAGMLLTVSLAGFLVYAGVPPWFGVIAGGYIGAVVAQMAASILGFFGAGLMLATVMLASCIVMTRLSPAVIIVSFFERVLGSGLRRVCAGISAFIESIVRCVRSIVQGIRLFIQRLIAGVWSLAQKVIPRRRRSDSPASDGAPPSGGMSHQFEHSFDSVKDTVSVPRPFDVSPRDSSHGFGVPAYNEPSTGQENADDPPSPVSLEDDTTFGGMKMHGDDLDEQGYDEHTLHKEVDVGEDIQQARPYVLPQPFLLSSGADWGSGQQIGAEHQEQAMRLEEKLAQFAVAGRVVSIKPGPVVTLFEYEPEAKTKISKILSLENDLALALRATGIRIIAPIPGRSVVGFEVSNRQIQDVLLGSVIQHDDYNNFSGILPLALGVDTIGTPVIADLTRMPHLLVAGSTGSGKSVSINTMLLSLLYRCSPSDVRLILIDPKRLELSTYADIAHLLFPIVVDSFKVPPVLRWVVEQMEERYRRMAEQGVRDLDGYNEAMCEGGGDTLPRIVLVIDELADLMLTVGREVEELIVRIAQMARAAGIHMIVATQRPSVDVVTGLIKVNFPSRISFRLASKADSRTVLDCSGAEHLLGRGDMLLLDGSHARVRRVHGAYVSDEEMHSVVSCVREYGLPVYEEVLSSRTDDSVGMMGAEDEQLYEQVEAFVKDEEEISISLLQRKFSIGYNRSARIVERLEAQGVVTPCVGGKMRKVVRSHD